MSYESSFTQEAPIEEKFITFLPHSGLHNQRIALINALVLAKALNRTLIVPELNIGVATFWRPSPGLELRLDQCTHGENARSCSDYRQYVPVPAKAIFDLSPLEKFGIRTIERLDMRRDYFERNWGVPLDARNASLVYQFEDNARYSYQLYDKKNGKKHPGNFATKVYLEDLRSQQEKFILFGSLFGSHRLVLEEDAELILIREYLRQELAIIHPAVRESAANVVDHLGGPAQFVSIHLRQGDGVFRKTVSVTLDQIRTRLQAQTSTTQDDIAFERLNAVADNRMQLLKECIRASSPDPRLQVIYMATDAPQPRERFASLYSEFLCLFSLHDFPQISVSKLLLPLVDAEVAAHASNFIGTPKSTYTGYIQQRNEHFLYTRST
ncbi:hypothetical protein EC973_003493 [Apophysomyces ossiformis]|uniref:O-fucosyltransferase family protein n=1 Tax=Apophysomyces ossiformis TaxID=679940 RepID=A0A8H7EQK3_9FUNG|nr:hypothetical protein EC973_003493 [Apophysomyces ossiformis]